MVYFDLTPAFYKILDGSKKGVQIEKPSKPRLCKLGKVINALEKDMKTKTNQVLPLPFLQDIQQKFQELTEIEDRPNHEKAMLIYIQEKIQKAGEAAQMHAIKQQKKKQTMDSFFKPQINAIPAGRDIFKDPKINITDDQEKKWEAENVSLQAMLMNDVDQLRETTKKVEEIGQIIGVMSTKIEEQQEMTENLLVQAEENTNIMERAEKQLQTAKEASQSYKFWVMMWFLGASVTLHVLDWIF